MRQPGIVALHAVTSTNAIHYAYRMVASDKTRRLLLLQNAAFLPLFRQAMQSRGNVGTARIDQTESSALSSPGPEAIEEIFSDVSGNRVEAARKVLGFLSIRGNPKELIDAARRLIFLKGSDSHDYKFSSAVLEDYYQVSPVWRDRYLASSMFQLRGSQGTDNQLVARARAALQG